MLSSKDLSFQLPAKGKCIHAFLLKIITIIITSSLLTPQNKIKPMFSSVAQLCLTLCDPMNCSMTGFPVHHQLPELAQTHIHSVSDAIQSSLPLVSPTPPAFRLAQHQGLF